MANESCVRRETVGVSFFPYVNNKAVFDKYRDVNT